MKHNRKLSESIKNFKVFSLAQVGDQFNNIATFSLPIAFLSSFIILADSQWISPNQILPARMYSPSVGHYENTLSIIYLNDLIVYNISNDTFKLYEDVISDNDAYSFGQYSTQINNTMYMISRTPDNLSIFSIYDLSISHYFIFGRILHFQFMLVPHVLLTHHHIYCWW